MLVYNKHVLFNVHVMNIKVSSVLLNRTTSFDLG